MERESSFSVRKAAAGLAVMLLAACAVAMTVNAGEAVRARSSTMQTRRVRFLGMSQCLLTAILEFLLTAVLGQDRRPCPRPSLRILSPT